MPSRILREGILTSERVDALPWPAEVFYRRLMSVVDDFGRYYAKPELLLSACFPLRVTKVRLADIATWIGSTREAGLVRTYQVDGKDYLEMVDFRQQVRAKESRFPAPAEHLRSKCVADVHLDVDVDVDVFEGGVTPLAPSASTPPAGRAAEKRINGHDKAPDASPVAITIPLIGKDEFTVTEAMVRQWDELYPAVDVMQTLREIKGWNLSHPTRRKTPRGIAAHITGWLSKEQNK